MFSAATRSLQVNCPVLWWTLFSEVGGCKTLWKVSIVALSAQCYDDGHYFNILLIQKCSPHSLLREWNATFHNFMNAIIYPIFLPASSELQCFAYLPTKTTVHSEMILNVVVDRDLLRASLAFLHNSPIIYQSPITHLSIGLFTTQLGEVGLAPLNGFITRDMYRTRSSYFVTF